MAKVQAFEEHADAYEAWFETHRAAYESELAAVRRLYSPGKNVEIGVGTGRFAGPLGVSYGVDPSGAMIRLSSLRGIRVARAAAERLPFRPETFDGCLFVTTLCFVDDVGRSLQEAHRVLKPGGAILVGFVDRESPIGLEYERRRARSAFYRDATFYSAPEVMRRLEEAGFENEACVQTLFGPPDEVAQPEPAETGFGRGSFVVVRARKTEA